MTLKLFVDTWGWLALADREDPRHKQAAASYTERSKLTGQVFTSNFVLDETLTILFSRRPFEEAWRFTQGVVGSPFLKTELVTPGRFQKALELRRKFSDKPKISFTDLSSMVIMKELGISDVLTADSHFSQVDLGFRMLPE
ncbi:MAG: PIN domain-containing protein [Candidatus Acidiferrales bacterium]